MLMFIPTALRYDVGIDYLAYIRIFNTIKNKRDLAKIGFGNLEGGYVWLNKAFAYIGLDGQWVLATMAFLTLFFLFCATPKKSFYIIIPFYFVLQYSSIFNIVRQGLVITMGYYAYQLFNKNKKIKAFLIVFIAFFFHKTALLYFFLFLFLLIFNIKKKHALILFLVIVFCMRSIYGMNETMSVYRIHPSGMIMTRKKENDEEIQGKTILHLKYIKRKFKKIKKGVVNKQIACGYFNIFRYKLKRMDYRFIKFFLIAFIYDPFIYLKRSIKYVRRIFGISWDRGIPPKQFYSE
jgi:hypothetical protein